MGIESLHYLKQIFAEIKKKTKNQQKIEKLLTQPFNLSIAVIKIKFVCEQKINYNRMKLIEH